MKDFFCHESSYIDDGVYVGSGTKIWHFSHLQGSVGENCSIGQNVYIAAFATVGSGVKIQNNVSVYDRVIIRDDVFIGPSVVFTNVTIPRAFIDKPLREYKETIVEEGATIGANSTIVCGSKIGKYAVVGAGSVVTRDVPDHALVYGNPAKVKGWVCKCGNKIKEINKGIICPQCLSKDEE